MYIKEISRTSQLSDLRRHSQEELKVYDTDGDGSIDREEWTNAMRDTIVDCGWEPYLYHKDVVAWMDSLFERVDVGGDGRMGRKEVSYTVVLANDAINTGAFRDVAMASHFLLELDTDGDGEIDGFELASCPAQYRVPITMDRRRGGRASGDGGGPRAQLSTNFRVFLTALPTPSLACTCLVLARGLPVPCMLGCRAAAQWRGGLCDYLRVECRP